MLQATARSDLINSNTAVPDNPLGATFTTVKSVRKVPQPFFLSLRIVILIGLVVIMADVLKHLWHITVFFKTATAYRVLADNLRVQDRLHVSTMALEF